MKFLKALVQCLCFPLLILMASCSHSTADGPNIAMLSKKKGQKGHVHIAQRKKSSHKPLIVIDPGHGDHDSGAHYHNAKEKQLNLLTSQMVKKYLNAKGYRVMLTRNGDHFIPLLERAQLANQAKCAAFVSIHYNSAPNKSASGVEVYYYHKAHEDRQKESKKLAGNVIDHIIKETGAKNRGVKYANFCVIRETAMPAILIEGGFLTHPNEVSLLKDSKYLDKLARGIADGVDRFFQ